MKPDKNNVFHFQRSNDWYTDFEQQVLQVTPKNFPVLVSSTSSSMARQAIGAVTTSSSGATTTTVSVSSVQDTSASSFQKQETTATGVTCDSADVPKPLAPSLLDYLKEFRESVPPMVLQDTASSSTKAG